MYGQVKFDGDETIEINKKSTEAIGKGKNAKVIREGYTSNQKITFTNKNSGKTYTGTVVKDLGNGKFTFKAEDGKTYNSDGLGSNWQIKSLDEVFEGGFVSRGAILKALADVGSASEIRQYLTSLEQAGDKFETVEDYVEDFKNYVADKSLNESYNPFPMNEDQEAVLKRYAESTGIAFENLLNMVAEAKAKKKAKKDYDGDGEIESSEEEYKGSRDKAIKNAMSEDVYSDGQNYIDITDLENLTPEQLNIVRQIADEWGLTQYDLENDAVLTDIEEELKIRLQAVNSTDPMNENDAFESDNEPHELHILLAQLAKSAIGLAKDLKVLEMEGVNNLPQWFQAKIIIAKSYIQGAKEYLDGEIGNEMDEAILAKTTDPAHNADAIKQINSKVPNTLSRAELTKAFNSGKTVDL
jgi:hypothetical protein